MSAFTDRFFSKPLLWKFISSAGHTLKRIGVDLGPPPLQVTPYSIKSVNWPAHYKPLKIVLASDFHVGCTTVSLEDLRQIVTRINALKPDIILLPGDFVNSPYGHDGVYVEPKEIASVLSNLKARYGVYATLGNHDCYEDPTGLWDALKDVGITVLHNDSTTIEHHGSYFALVGVGDSTTGNADCKEAFSYAAAGLPVIAMCHNPISIHDMPENLTVAVAGHTHGNQYNIPFVPQPILGCPDRGLSYGLQKRSGKPVVVTGGIGTSLVPFRNRPPEIVDLDIYPA